MTMNRIAVNHIPADKITVPIKLTTGRIASNHLPVDTQYAMCNDHEQDYCQPS